MAERESALRGHYKQGRFGEPGEPGMTLTEVPGLKLFQLAAWPDTVEEVGAKAAAHAGAASAPGPGRVVAGSNGALLRVEPVKWWLYGATADKLDPGLGATLDLSHSRTHVRAAGPRSRECLNRLLPIDLRAESFDTGSVAASSMHHVGVTVWRSEDGFELFLPRGFAVSLWEVLLATAEQFGVEVL